VIQEAYVQGVSTRAVDDLVKAMGMTGISKSQVSRLCKDIDARVKAFLERPIEGDWPLVWLDATYLKARQPRLQERSSEDPAWRARPSPRCGCRRGGGDFLVGFSPHPKPPWSDRRQAGDLGCA